MGGSPCQGFSVAGKQLDFDDPRSKLFFEFVRLKDELKPKYFLMENVPMKQESQDIITKYLGVKPVTINSSLFSAQNRKRLYWTNIPFDIPTEDKGIILQDILEDGIANEAMTNQDGKAHCITARYNGAVWWNSIQRKQRTMVQVGEADNIKGFDSIKRIYSPSGKSPTLTTMQGGHREPKVAIDLQSNGMQWRKLTPVECERLQTVPDNYTDYVSNSQRYKMLGNGWTVDVIAHILKGISND
jgi:DNA-cytosine methyltransferase